MADANESPAPIGDVVEEEVGDDAAPVGDDVLLNLIVHLAESGASAPITLYTHGLVMTGVLISRTRYFEASAAFLKESPFRVLFEQLLPHVPELDESAVAPDYRYVHLRDAQVMTPGQKGMPDGGVLMRIKRDDVIGWSFGQLKFG